MENYHLRETRFKSKILVVRIILPCLGEIIFACNQNCILLMERIIQTESLSNDVITWKTIISEKRDLKARFWL